MGIIDKVKKVTEKKAEEPADADELVSVDAEEALAARQRKIEDVLEILQIPATFEIPNDVFLPDDLRDVDFDHQVPYGYDLGQVTRFVGQARNSIRLYVNLLKERNEHIAKLATVVDKLQVDANNLRFEAEIANGISVMPSADDGDLEDQLMEARLEIRRLEDRLKKAEAAPKGAGNGDAYEKVMDQLSLAKREIADLKDENAHLRATLAHMEESMEDPADYGLTRSEKPLSESEYRDLGLEGSLPSFEQELAYPVSEDFTRPAPAETTGKTLPRPGSRSLAFEIDDDTEDLDKIIEGWGKGDSHD